MSAVTTPASLKKKKGGWEVALIKEELDWNKQDDE